MRRWWKLVLLAVLVAAIVAAFAGWRALRNGGRTTAVPPEEAVNRFRVGATDPSSPSTPPTSARAPSVLPEYGVYVYATTGSDSVDALGGAQHTYPTTTTLTVSPSGCGVAERWIAADERWDETLSCPVAGGVVMRHFLGFHRFFGGDSTDDYVCDGDPRPVDAPAGTTWTTTCQASDETSVYHGTVVGREDLAVGGQPIATLHVATVIDDGDPDDHQAIDSWYQVGTDLVVRRTAHLATQSSSPVGLVHYREDYQIDLLSLGPQR